MKRLVLDTSVLIEFIVAGSRYRDIIHRIFADAKQGSLELYVCSVTLAEVLYIASRIYKASGVVEFNEEAKRFAPWIRSRARVIDADYDIAFLAGELRKRFRIALPDCFVIAVAKRVRGYAVFKNC